MKCTAKHTKYQPTTEEFACPKCGATPDDDEGFYVDCSPEGSDDECCLLHDDDEIACIRCGHGVTGKQFAAGIAKKKNLVKCPHCKGTGLIDGPKP